MAARRLPRPCALIGKLNQSLYHSTSFMLLQTQMTLPTVQSPCQARLFASAPSRNPSYADVFTLSDIPLSSFETVISRNGNSFKDISPEEYYAVAQKFSDSVNRGSSPWAASFTASTSLTGLPSLCAKHTFTTKPNSALEDCITAETLHQVGCIMRQITGPRSADAFATALWSTASEMGHRPSTLSLTRQLIRSGAYSRISQLRKVEVRFKHLVASGKDADALTAEGELLFEQGRFDVAAATLNKALRLSSEFEWRPYCELCLGRAYLRMGKVDEARGLFEKLADEGLVEADVELGEMLGKSDVDEAEQRMYTAACNGRRDMFTRLSEMELERAGDGRDAAERRLRALEWSKLADGRVEY